MTKIDAGEHKPIDDLAAASAAAAANLIRASQGGTEAQMTLSQLSTLIKSDVGDQLTAANSAITFTPTATLDSTFGAVSSGVNYSFSTKGEFEALIEQVKDLKVNMDELKA